MRQGFALLLAWLAACAPVQAVEPGSQPGALPYPEATLTALRQAWASRPQRYTPRTRHLTEAGEPRYLNRLFLATSPYLLQHAHNPVDWRPWGDEAFEEARRLGRPVLLSVGYSTCHWCHVMEEESFEDEEIAELLNRNYIAIKVDREERPDVDALYMSAVALLNGGSGGWPMTVWLTPNREPYYATSYIPPHDGDRGARVGFLTLLGKMRDVYAGSPDTVANNAAALTQQIQRMTEAGAAGDLPGVDALDRAAAIYTAQFDRDHGGLAGAPKFPSSLPVRFLLRRGGGQMAVQALDAMARGGLFDQVGGGFHRYTIDAAWRIPHFEKMLYDNALLVKAYLEAYQSAGREDFARVARETLEYLEREMTAPEGGFYSASDADSLDPATGERVEGRFFTWTHDEISQALGADAAQAFLAVYPLTADAEVDGRFVLHRAGSDSLDASRRRLFEARSARPQPFRDEKIVTAWNGLAISAFAFAAFVLDDPSYAERADAAADFVLANLRSAGPLPDGRGSGAGRLARSYRDGRTSGAAFLDDYAFLIAGLLDLYESTGNVRRLEQALELDRELEASYEDRENGGFYFTAADHEELIQRRKPVIDEAEPSGNSVQILNLLRLHEFTTDDRFRARADRALRAFASTVEADPTATSELLLAIAFRRSKPNQILLVTPSGDAAGAAPLMAVLRTTFTPNRILAVASEPDLPQTQTVIPLFEDKRAIGGNATVYVCQERICRLPTSDPGKLAELLGPQTH
jgi:hypothetical protein